jgi:SAM-dependent methyltransferase
MQPTGAADARTVRQREDTMEMDTLIRPEDLNWQEWVNRWDRMQERYLVKRTERFETIVRILQGIAGSVEKVIDLGCGTGSLMLSILKSFPKSRVYGIDFDPTMVWLAEARLAQSGSRSQILHIDLRDSSWIEQIPKEADAVVSATALHWFSPTQLSELYYHVASLLRAGGIFLNADHVGSDSLMIQKTWENHRAEMRAQEAKMDSDDWDGFWNAYSKALGLDTKEIHQRVIGGWEGGIEEGLPLVWHLDKLREIGFVSLDCFWRCDCDAIYGGIRDPEKAEQSR